MEPKYQTSFIPKKPVMTTGQSQSGGMSLLLLVSLIIFLISLGLAGYVYLEKNILVKSIETNIATIEQNKSGLTSDSLTIESLVELNNRINVAKDILSRHVAISPIFSFLQQTTLKSVRFKNFNFSVSGKDTSGLNKVSVQMSGIATNWETVALQADEFGKSDWKKIITEPKISNLSLNADGSISFLFSAFISPNFLIYGNTITNN
jgi:hypothetical protein